MAPITKKVTDEIAPEQVATDTQADWVWVEIPERDLTDHPFGGVGINLMHFGGPAEVHCDCADFPNCKNTRRHKVPAEIAREIQERVALCKAADLRIYTNRRDMKALLELVKNNPSYSYFDPNLK